MDPACFPTSSIPSFAIPFSSSHQYQRSDSWWARKYACEENDHLRGFKPSNGKKLLPIFQSIFFLKDNDELKFEKKRWS